MDFQALADSPFILFEAGFALNAMILAACERKGVVPKVTAACAESTSLSTWSGVGVGVALPRMLAHKHLHPGITLVPLDAADTNWHIALAFAVCSLATGSHRLAGSYERCGNQRTVQGGADQLCRRGTASLEVPLRLSVPLTVNLCVRLPRRKNFSGSFFPYFTRHGPVPIS